MSTFIRPPIEAVGAVFIYIVTESEIGLKDSVEIFCRFCAPNVVGKRINNERAIL